MIRNALASDEARTGASVDAGIISQAQIRVCGKAWHRLVLDELAMIVGHDDFPCIFSRNAYQKELLLFTFTESLDSAGIARLAQSLTCYVERSASWDGRLATAYPLVMAFSLDLLRTASIADYHAFGWHVLQKLHEVDPAPWPQQIPRDPNAPEWSMCFNGMPLFCNMSHPAHQARRSRNLGQHFMFVINPRERFDVVAGDSPNGRKMRAQIRQRLQRFDGIAHAPQLGLYGAGGIEWWQYALPDDNIERTDKCPFVFQQCDEA